MKKAIFISFIAVLIVSFKEPEGLKWYSLSEGVELARRENKPMLIFVYVNWCDKCQRMEKKIFTNMEVLPLITENFIPVKLNPEVDTIYFHNDKTLKRKFFIKEVSPGKMAIAVPTTAFYRDDDSDPFIMNGLMDPAELKDNITSFLNNK
jgi:thioredoxin-related protein